MSDENQDGIDDVRQLVYGPVVGEYHHDAMYGPQGNLLGPTDVALSPDLQQRFPLGSVIEVNGEGPYTVADHSYHSPGRPNTNTIELRNTKESGGRVRLTPYNPVPSLAEASNLALAPEEAASLADAGGISDNSPAMASLADAGQFPANRLTASLDDSGESYGPLSQADTGDSGDATGAEQIALGDNAPAAQTQDEVHYPVAAHPEGLKPAEQSPDGSWVKFNDGTVYNKIDQSLTYKGPDGSTWKMFRNQPKPVKIANAPAQGKTHQVVKDSIDPDTGQPYTQVINIDSQTGKVVGTDRLTDPSAQAQLRTEMIKQRIINNATKLPAITDYVRSKNAYDSLVRNAAIPASKRTAADDQAAMQAFGAIEHPGSAVTDQDKKLVAEGQTLGQRMRNFMTNFSGQKRLLAPEYISQLKDAAGRALESRQQTYDQQITPFIKEGARFGLSPDDIHIGVGSKEPSATPTTQSFEAGHWYQDANGNWGKYLGNGKWGQ